MRRVMFRTPHPRGNPRAIILGCLVILAASSLRAQERPPAEAQPPQRFRSGIELVALDVTVVDHAGTPVDGLTPADFTVKVDGKPRRVASAQFISFHPPAPTTSAGAPAGAAPRVTAPPSTPTRGRDVFIVIDEDSLETGDGQVARLGAMALIDGLGPGDRVGIATVPRPKLNFKLSANRAVNERELAAWVPGASLEPRSKYWIGVSEAFAIASNDTGVRDKVVSRECAARGDGDPLCARDVVSEARQLAMRMHARGTITLEALKSLARALRQLEGPKTMVLVSGGLMTPESMSSFTDLESELAASQITLYALYFEKVSNNVARAGLSPTQADDDRIEEYGLENVASAAGGTILRVIGPAETYFARVATELSAAYLLGIEVEPGDRNGKPHRVEIKVQKPGLDLHGRKQYVIPAERKAPQRP
jgi:VWFA-related protein